MCYAKPGPRCAGHVKTEMTAAQAHLDANLAAFATGQAEPHPEVTPATLVRLQEEFDGTWTGQRELAAAIEAESDPAARAALEERRDRAAAVYAEKKAALESVEGQWGVVNVTEGSRTPWGEAQSVSHPAAGIAVVGTAGHGGIKLSPQRNALIPAPLRNKSGWYEEDCEASIVGMYHPEAFPHYQGGDYDKIRAACEASVKNWSPDEYERATGQSVAVEESTVLRDRARAADTEAFRAAHANEFVSLGRGSTTSQEKWIPEGYAVTTARIDATGETRDFLVPKDQVIHDKMWGKHVLIDPRRAVDVTAVMAAGRAPKVERQPVRGEALTVDCARLSPRAAQAASAELGQRFRWEDGSVSSFRDRLAQVGVTGKNVTSSGYHVALASGGSYSVKKATFDALATVPDTTTEVDRARIACSRAAAAMDRVSAFDREKKARAEAKYRAAAEKVKAAEAKDRAENPLRYYDGIQAARAEAFAALVAEKGLSFND